MRANSSHVNFNDDRQREHQRQQERLKAMAANSDKVQMVSADQLIENLLKDSFKKLPQTPFPVNQLDHSNIELPLWLQCESDAVPAHYKYLWSLVQSTMDLADTQKVSQLLLTSGLQVDILGFIWNLANKKTPGQLTKQEFYIVLALVSLAQSGYAFNNLSVLKLMTVPSIPVLHTGFQKFPTHQFNASQNSETANISTSKEFVSSFAFESKPFVNTNEREKNEDNLNNSAVNVTALFSDFKTSSISQKEKSEIDIMPSNSISKTSEPFFVDQSKESHKNTNFPCIGSSPTAELEDDFTAFQSVSADKIEDCKSTNQPSVDPKDDFTEFQSAVIEHSDPFETIVINQKRDVPKIPFPKAFTGKFTNLKSSVLKISPETEKKLKVLSPSESLSSLPESKISSSNKVSTSLSVLGSNHGIGSRLANHSVRLDTKTDRSKCHKHHKININSNSPINSSSEEEIILGVKPRNLEGVIPKCNPKNSSTCKTFILKETKIRSDETTNVTSFKQDEIEQGPSTVQSGKNTRQIEIPMLGTFNETVLPTQSKSESPTIDLISVQEDKYSALRDIELELNQEKTSDAKEVNDDFGDFLSADIPTNPEPESFLPVTQSSIPTNPEPETFMPVTQSFIPPNPEPDSFMPVTQSSILPNPEPEFFMPVTQSSIPPNPEPDSSLPVTLSSISNSDSLTSKEVEKDEWGDWNFSTEANSYSANTSVLDLPQTNIISDVKETPASKAENDLFDVFSSLSVSKESNNVESQPDIFSQEQKDSFGLEAKGDNVNDVIILEDKNEKLDDIFTQAQGDHAFNTQQDNEIWDFLSTDIKPQSRDVSRHSSLPSLDLKISPVDESEQEAIWRKCLDSCHGLIQEGYDIINSIGTKSVLDEVFASPKIEEYLNNLNIVFQISKRVSQNFNNFPSIQEDLEKLWVRLQDLCFEYNIKLKHDEDNCSEGKIRCNICLRRIGYNVINQGTNSYHPSCANLWINCVEPTLPSSV